MDGMKHYEEKMNDILEDLRKHRQATGTEQAKFLAELKKTNTDNGKLMNDFANHQEAY